MAGTFAGAFALDQYGNQIKDARVLSLMRCAASLDACSRYLKSAAKAVKLGNMEKLAEEVANLSLNLQEINASNGVQLAEDLQLLARELGMTVQSVEGVPREGHHA